MKPWLFKWRNRLTFFKPVFVRFDYVPVIVRENPVLLFSWEIRSAYRINISKIGFKSYAVCGSAYIGLNQQPPVLKVRIRSWWRSTAIEVDLVEFAGLKADYHPQSFLPVPVWSAVAVLWSTARPAFQAPPSVKPFTISMPEFLPEL